MDVPPALTTLGDKAAPPDLAGDLRRLLRLPPEALGKLWQALGPCLAETISRETEQLLDVFCAAYKVPDDDLARAIKACRFLIQEAARQDLSAAALGADIERLCPDEPLIKELILAGYEPAKAQIRKDIMVAALVGHGNLLVGATWRLDVVASSDRGTKLGTPVAILTLHYKEGSETRRITLQALPDMMLQLKGICEQVLPPA